MHASIRLDEQIAMGHTGTACSLAYLCFLLYLCVPVISQYNKYQIKYYFLKYYFLKDNCLKEFHVFTW